MNANEPILVLVETLAGVPTRASLQAITAARSLSDAVGGGVHAVALGSEAAEAAVAYVPVVHQAELPQDNQESRVRVLVAALATTGASVLIAAGTRTTAAVAPRVALRAGGGSAGALLEEVTSLTLTDGAVVATRLTQLQRVTETIRATATPVVVTVKIGAFEAVEPAPGHDDAGSGSGADARTGTGADAAVDAGPSAGDGAGDGAGADVATATRGEVRLLEVDFTPLDARVEVRAKAATGGARLGLEEADVVVAGGRGLGAASAFATLVEPLANRLGATIGATRAVVDAGWRPYDEQIGQTGKSVAPAIYLALGVSGAVQHLSGMNRSRRVIAINKDADAPIFKHCDIGVVGDVHEVVPKLIEALGDG